MSNYVEGLLTLRDQLCQEYNRIVKYEEVFWYQQAKGKWIVIGDMNSRFFYASVIQRIRKNKIYALQSNEDDWIYDELVLKDMILSFYKSLYSSANIVSSVFSSSNSFLVIKEEDMTFLSSNVSVKETISPLVLMGFTLFFSRLNVTLLVHLCINLWKIVLLILTRLVR